MYYFCLGGFFVIKHGVLVTPPLTVIMVRINITLQDFCKCLLTEIYTYPECIFYFLHHILSYLTCIILCVLGKWNLMKALSTWCLIILLFYWGLRNGSAISKRMMIKVPFPFGLKLASILNAAKLSHCHLMCFLWSVLQEDAQEESGWKQVHGDVFRPPRNGMLLSVFLGQGTQIFIMTFITLCEENLKSDIYLRNYCSAFFLKKAIAFCVWLMQGFWRLVILVYWYFFELLFSVLACLGFLSPANRGALMTCAVVLWVLLGTPAGYVSARLYKSKDIMYKKTCLLIITRIMNKCCRTFSINKHFAWWHIEVVYYVKFWK